MFPPSYTLPIDKSLPQNVDLPDTMSQNGVAVLEEGSIL